MTFRIWAPDARRVDIAFAGNAHPAGLREHGLFEAHVDEARPGDLYSVVVDGKPPLPDPASRFQPQGVHGPSQVVDPAAFRWTDERWRGVPASELVIYELHTGTFTHEGTFAAISRQLRRLAALGITAIELMPVADFPGRWNWGYDPAAMFAPSRAYGTPDDLRRLVDAAHAAGIAVLLDVVYNHFGPDGAYAPAISPRFFNDRHRTPWGPAINLDGEGSRFVRDFLVQNALAWLGEYHLDGLRLDATFALHDDSPTHFLAELRDAVDTLPGPHRILIAEDPRNLAMLARPRAEGGYGLDAIWADDFHHLLRRLIAGDREGYYRDFGGGTRDLATVVEDGWLFQGQRSEHERGPRGTSPAGLPPSAFVFCIQNHDQVGNRPAGDRLHHAIAPEAFRAATATLLFAPQTPMLFMGQEWAAASPFQYFTDHEPKLGALVSKGRHDEFADFAGFSGEVPDPQDPRTFSASRLDHAERERPAHAAVETMTRDLLAVRRLLEGGARASSPAEGALVVERGKHVLLAAFRDGVTLPRPRGATLWNSEREEYLPPEDPPCVPAEDGDTITFARAGAVIVETP